MKFLTMARMILLGQSEVCDAIDLFGYGCFYALGGSFCGCPYDESPAVRGLYLILANSHIIVRST